MSLSSLKSAAKQREMLIYTICICFYLPIFNFIPLGSDFFVKKYGVSVVDANNYVAIPYLVGAACSPVVGFLVNYLGYSIQFVILASASLCAIHVTLLVAHFSIPFTMVWMGVSYAMCAASLLPMVALVVPTRELGMAYGLMTAFQNLGLAVLPLVLVPILGTTATLSQYYEVEHIFIYMSGFGAACALILMILDRSCYAGILSCSATRVKILQAAVFKGLSPNTAENTGLDALLSPNTTHHLRDEEMKKTDAMRRARGGSFHGTVPGV